MYRLKTIKRSVSKPCFPPGREVYAFHIMLLPTCLRERIAEGGEEGGSMASREADRTGLFSHPFLSSVRHRRKRFQRGERNWG